MSKPKPKFHRLPRLRKTTKALLNERKIDFRSGVKTVRIIGSE
jgi:hypothetical protein